MNLAFETEPFFITAVDRVIGGEEINGYFDAILPSGIIELWENYSEIGFGNSILIYGFDIAKERNAQYEVAKNTPDFLLIGDDGGGQGIFIKTDTAQLNVYYLGFGALGSSPMQSLNVNLFDWLQNNPKITIEAESSEMIDYVDLFVVNLPQNATKFAFDARRDLSIPLSAKEIKDGLNNLPFLLKERITLMKYGEAIKKLNSVHDCLKTIRKLTK